MSDDQPPKPQTDTFVHEPLPYLVTARIVLDDDQPPETRTVPLVAYSLLEAMVQASLLLGGGPGMNDAKVRIERIEPDIAAYLQMRQEAGR